MFNFRIQIGDLNEICTELLNAKTFLTSSLFTLHCQNLLAVENLMFL